MNCCAHFKRWKTGLLEFSSAFRVMLGVLLPITFRKHGQTMDKGFSARGKRGRAATKYIYYSNGHDLDAITTLRVFQQCR